jgi:GT2 family glycosyltransferase
VADPRGKKESSTAAPRVAVIVPTYRSRPFLPACLGSLEAQTDISFEIIVTDNNSRDGSVEYIKEHHPKVRLLEHGSNLGFSAAVNRGLNLKGDASYIALINPDARAEPLCLSSMVRALERFPTAGIAAARMMKEDPPDRIDSLGVAVTPGFGQVSIGGGLRVFAGFEKPCFVPAACGGGMMFRVEVIERAGLFDEDYFLCWEDIEFSFRAYRHGFKCLFVPEAVVRHLGGAIMGRTSGVNAFHYCRGALPTAVKLLPFTDLLLLMPRILLNRMKVVVLQVGRGGLIASIRGELSSLGLAARMLGKRRNLPAPGAEYRLRDLLEEGQRIRKRMKQES